MQQDKKPLKSFRRRLLDGDILIGTLISLPSPEVAELLSKTRLDWLFIDGEHGPFDTLQIQRMQQAASSNCACLIRVPSHDAIAIKRALDTGATGVIVPQINNAEQARTAVRAAKYPPHGNRGVGLARAHEYGFSFSSYLETANQETCIVIQAETGEAIDNIEDIVAVKDIDAILIGPYDLSANLGHTGQVEHPAVLSAIDKVADACRQANVKLGYFGVDAQAVRPYIDKGFTLITAGVDSLLLLESAQQLLRELA